MRASRLQIVSLAALLIAFFGWLAWNSWEAANRNNEPEVVIGYLPIYVDLPLFVAVDKGFLDDEGIRYRLERFTSSPDIGNALVQNQVQVGASIAYAVVLSTESRDSGRLQVFLVDSEDATNYLSSIVVLNKSGIKTLADLRGKKVASFPGPAALTFFRMVLEKNGLKDGENVTVIELDQASHLSALEAGLVDALFTYEPTATQAVLEKNATKLLPGAVESQVISPWQAGVWVVSTQFAASQPDLAKKVIRAIYRAVDFIRADPAAAKASLQKYTSISPKVAAATPTIPFAKLGEVDLDAFQKHADILFDRKVVSRRITAQNLLAPSAWVPSR